MNKVLTLGAALIAALSAATAGAADNGKHFGNGHGNGHAYGHGNGHGHGHHRPVYRAPSYGHNYYAPTRGYWHGGRWIAPVVVGGIVAAAVGSAYGYGYSTPDYGHNSYVAPSYYAPATVTYAAPVSSGFEYADANRDGYVSFDEAAVYPHWQRNFGNMDRNRDGYLTRDEVSGWRYR